MNTCARQETTGVVLARAPETQTVCCTNVEAKGVDVFVRLSGLVGWHDSRMHKRKSDSRVSLPVPSGHDVTLTLSSTTETNNCTQKRDHVGCERSQETCAPAGTHTHTTRFFYIISFSDSKRMNLVVDYNSL